MVISINKVQTAIAMRLTVTRTQFMSTHYHGRFAPECYERNDHKYESNGNLPAEVYSHFSQKAISLE